MRDANNNSNGNETMTQLCDIVTSSQNRTFMISVQTPCFATVYRCDDEGQMVGDMVKGRILSDIDGNRYVMVANESVPVA